MQHITSSAIADPDRFSYWRELVGGMYDVQRPSIGGRDFFFQSTFAVLETMFLSEVICSPTVKWRGKKHLSLDGQEFIKIRRYKRGSGLLLSDERPMLLRPGATYLMSQSREFTEISSENHQFNVFLPSKSVGLDVDATPSVIEFRDDSSEGAILTAVFEALFSDATLNDEGAQSVVATEFLSTIRELLAGGGTGFEDKELVRVRRRAMENTIDQFLRSTGDGTEELINKLPFSRATVYRHFEQEGGVAAYVRRRRLSLAYESLSRSSGHGIVSRVAESSGYSSVHSFHKAFKREFLVTPGEIVGTKHPENDNCPPKVSQFADGSESIRALNRAWNEVRGLR